jgi:hypothetical protein
MLEQYKTTYKLCQQDYTTWGLANYQHKKRLQQHMLDREHATRRSAAYYKQIERDNVARQTAAALTIFLWNRRLRMRWWFDDHAMQRRRRTAATTILLWNRRIRLQWWLEDQSTVCNVHEQFDDERLNNNGDGRLSVTKSEDTVEDDRQYTTTITSTTVPSVESNNTSTPLWHGLSYEVHSATLPIVSACIQSTTTYTTTGTMTPDTMTLDICVTTRNHVSTTTSTHLWMTSTHLLMTTMAIH